MGQAGAEFDRLLDRAERLLGQKQLVAHAIGIKPPRYSRLRAHEGGYTLNVRNCFRLAKLVNETPQRVLRAAGKSDLADALDEFYGASTVATPTGLEWLDSVSVPAVRAVARAMMALPEHAQETVAAVAVEMQRLLEAQTPARPVYEAVGALPPAASTRAERGRRLRAQGQR